MRVDLFRKIFRLEGKMADISMQKSIMSRRRTRRIIPEEYFIEVITTIPERKAVVESNDF